jgi:signal transduction histidine kinase
MSRRSLRLRLLLFGAASVTLALILSAFGLVLLFERHVERQVDAELDVHLTQLVAGLGRDGAGNIVVLHPPADPRFHRPFSGLYWQLLIEGSGSVLRSRSLWDVELPLPSSAPNQSNVHGQRLSGPAGSTLQVVDRRFELPERLGGASARALAGLDTRDIDKTVAGFVQDLVPFLVLIGAFLIAAAWAQVTLGLRPLSVIRERLTAIGSGGAQRLGSGFPDEVNPLAQEIDRLLDARDADVTRARARAADLAHGLRTPLQVLAGDAERLEQKGEAEIASQLKGLVASMHRHVERELNRARLRAGAVQVSADVREVAERVINVVRRTACGRELAWDIDVSPSLRARIDPDDLAEALGNLLENAARHARSRVGVLACSSGDGVLIKIVDDGPGIPAERVAEALTRGKRLDTLGSGRGLGLAIVSDIAEAWGARLAIEPAAPGLQASLKLERP